jgi:hypothetical protein
VSHNAVAHIKVVEVAFFATRHMEKEAETCCGLSAKKGNSSAHVSTPEKAVGASPTTTPEGATRADSGLILDKSSTGGSPDSKSPKHIFIVPYVCFMPQSPFLQWPSTINLPWLTQWHFLEQEMLEYVWMCAPH